MCRLSEANFKDKDTFPFLRIHESFNALNGVAKWFLSLDLVSGYNQVAMDEKDRHKAVFTTPFGLYVKGCALVFATGPQPFKVQSINQTSIAPISLAKPGSVVQHLNQCSTAKSRKQFRKCMGVWLTRYSKFCSCIWMTSLCSRAQSRNILKEWTLLCQN